jgi:predicted alpha/beta hydrolase family esterase
MATTLLVPGLDGGGDGHWLNWFEATIPDAHRVALPDGKDMDLSEWSALVRWHIHRSDDPIWIVAHGFGCLAAVRAAFDCADRIEGALLVAPFDPDNLRLAWLLPEEPLGFPAAIVASSNDPHMRLSKAAFWAGFWSCEFINAGRLGGIDPAAGLGPWPAGRAMFDDLRQSPAVLMRQVGGKELSHLSRAI